LSGVHPTALRVRSGDVFIIRICASPKPNIAGTVYLV
jgi:hypothetical protein